MAVSAYKRRDFICPFRHFISAPSPKFHVHWMFNRFLDKQVNRWSDSQAPRDFPLPSNRASHPLQPPFLTSGTRTYTEGASPRTYCISVSSNLHASQLKPRPVRIQLCRPKRKERHKCEYFSSPERSHSTFKMKVSLIFRILRNSKFNSATCFRDTGPPESMTAGTSSCWPLSSSYKPGLRWPRPTTPLHA